MVRYRAGDGALVLPLLLLLGAWAARVVALDPALSALGLGIGAPGVPGPFAPEDEEAVNLQGEREDPTGIITADNEDELVAGEQDLMDASPVSGKPDEFVAMDAHSSQVLELVDQFMATYQDEVGRTALQATVLHVLKAQKTQPREELQGIEVGEDGADAVEIVQRKVTQIVRLFVLVNYGFQTSMLEAKRPYVSVLQISLDCVNSTTDRTAADDAKKMNPTLECDILEHVDLPRRNGSTEEVGPDLQHEIAFAAPAAFLKTHDKLFVHYDAVEMQDLGPDESDPENPEPETVTYLRFRVPVDTEADSRWSAQDCMVVVEEARGVKTLMYTDSVCYDEALAVDAGAPSNSTAVLTSANSTSNLPIVMLIVAALFGALVAAVLIVRHRRKSQRLGYAYVRSKAPSHVPTPAAAAGKTTYGDNSDTTAVAC